jgi:hypothetical protein
VWWNSRSRFKHCAVRSAVRSSKFNPISAIGLRAIDADLVCQLGRHDLSPVASSAEACAPTLATTPRPRPAFLPRYGLIRDMVDVFDFEQVLMSISSRYLWRRTRSAGMTLPPTMRGI